MKQQKSTFKAQRGFPMKAFWLNLKKYKYLYIMLLPGLLYYLIYKYLPIYGLIIAFKNYRMADGILGSPWIGLENFRRIFTMHDFYRIVGNTLLINLYSLLFAFPIPIILSLILNEFKNVAFKRSIQTVIYFPYFLSWVIFGGIVIQLLSPNDGLINQIIKFCGGEPIYFLSKSNYFRGIVVISSILKESGWGTIIYLAALSGIDMEQFEAALIDGANRLQKLRYIILPGIMNTIVLMLVLKIGYLLEVGFEQIYVLYNPSVYDVGDVLSTYIYRIGMQNMNFSLTAAIGLFQSVIGFTLILIANKLAKRYSDVSLW